MIRTGRTPEQVVITPRDGGKTDKPLDENLSAIKGRAPLPGNKVSGGQSPLDPNGSAHLGSVTGRAPLAPLSGKSAAIYGGLGEDLSARLDARLASASKAERKAIQEVLHFSYRDTGATSKEDRVAVRTAVAGYLAHGGGIEGAKLMRDAATDMSDKARKNLISAFAKQGDRHGAEIVSEHVLFARPAPEKFGTTETATERFQRFKPALLDFPPAPDKAGQAAFANEKVGMGYDSKGKLEVRSVAISMSDPSVPHANERLSQAKINEVRTVFDGIGDGNYSTQGVPLDFMRFFREENDKRGLHGQAPLGLTEAFARYQPNGAQITDSFNGCGDCMCHAERIVAELKSRGIEAQIVGHFSENLIQMTDPSRLPGSRGQTPEYTIPGQATATENVTHLDVIVPYTNQDGEARVILISPGVGTRAEDAYQDYAFSEIVTGPSSYKKVDPNTGRYDAALAQKAQFAGRHNLKLLMTPIDGARDQAKQVGIDLLAGKIYLNRNAADQYRAGHGEIRPGQEQGAISIDFKAVFSDPSGATTLRTWDDTTGAYKDVPTNKLTALLVMATAIKNEFGQPDHFVDDLLTLAENHESYRNELLAPPLIAMFDATAARNAAIQAKPGDDSPDLATWKTHFESAAECIADGDGETARKHYQIAASLGRQG